LVNIVYYCTIIVKGISFSAIQRDIQNGHVFGDKITIKEIRLFDDFG